MDLKQLLEKGYFPKELPPPFTTQSLAEKYDAVKVSLSNAVDKTASRCVNYSIPKFGMVRKLIKIPNPMHQVELCKIISENWADIESIISSSTISFSKPKLIGERAANPSKFKEFINKCFIESYPFSYKLKTDFAKYYPSIYTHSIPWAIHGKKVSKQKRSDQTLLGNKIDFCIRQTMDGQTIGIPIGPDTSLIISEIIGCAIDKEILLHFPDIKGFRFIDDIYFFFRSQIEAEAVLLKLQHVVRDFELQLNTEKTDIIRLPQGIEKDWVLQLRRFEIRSDSEIKQYNDILSFFSLVFDLFSRYQKESVLLYAIRKVKRIEVLSKKNFSLFENMLLKSMSADSSTIEEVFRILYTYKQSVDVNKLKSVLFELVKINCIRGYNYELSWLLWMVKTFKVKLSIDAISEIEKTSDTISILIALDLISEGLIDQKDINTLYWESLLDLTSLKDENWLLAYEVAAKKFLPNVSLDYIKRSPYFKILYENKISFYNPNNQISSIEGVCARWLSKDIATIDDLKENKQSNIDGDTKEDVRRDYAQSENLLDLSPPFEDYQDLPDLEYFLTVPSEY